MSSLVSKKCLVSLNPFNSVRDVVLSIFSGGAIALIVWLLSVMFSSEDWNLRGGILGAIAAILVTLFMLLPIAGTSERSMRNTIISRLKSLNYELEKRDNDGSFHFRRAGHVLTRWDSERVVIIEKSDVNDRIVAPFSVMRKL
jgi:hypothetical protein